MQIPPDSLKKEVKEREAENARIDKSHMVILFSLDWQLDYIWDIMTGQRLCCVYMLHISLCERRCADAFDLVKWGDPVSGCVNVMSSSNRTAQAPSAAVAVPRTLSDRYWTHSRARAPYPTFTAQP